MRRRPKKDFLRRSRWFATPPSVAMTYLDLWHAFCEDQLLSANLNVAKHVLREAELPGKSLGWWNSCTIARFSRCSVSISTLPVPTLLPVLDEGTRYRNRHPGAKNITDAVSINNNSARTWFPDVSCKKKSINSDHGFLASIISNLTSSYIIDKSQHQSIHGAGGSGRSALGRHARWSCHGGLPGLPRVAALKGAQGCPGLFKGSGAMTMAYSYLVG